MLVLPDRKQLRSLIGGRWAVSLVGYLLLAPIGILWLFTTVPEAFFTADGWPRGLFAGVTSYLVTGAVLWVASVTVVRDRCERSVPIATVVLIGALAWGARSGYLAWFIAAAGLPSDATPLVRIISGSLLGAIIVPAAAWALASVAAFAETRQQLIDELVAQEVRAEQSTAYIDAMRRGVIAEVTQAIDREFDELSATGEDVATVVERLANRMSRDLPRQLWQQRLDETAITPSIIIRTAARHPLAAWPLIPLMVLGMSVFVRFLPMVAAFVSLLAAVVWSWLVVALVNRWARRSTSLSPMVAGIICLLASGGVFSIALSFVAPFVNVSVAYALLVSASFTFSLTGAGLARAVSVRHKSVVADLRATIGSAEVQAAILEREERDVRREIATALHGTVGANLTAAAFRLRSSIQSGNEVSAIEALHEARRLVDVAMDSILLDQMSDPMNLVDQIAAAWDGLVSITGDVSVKGPVSPRGMRALDNVITEGVNNSVRHARARHISIRISSSQHLLHVEVKDDGEHGLRANPGLGSRILDHIAPGSWSLTPNDDGGSTLVVDIPT